MSSSQKLNSSELKSQLYHSLQEKGVLDAMKVSSFPCRESWREVQNRSVFLRCLYYALYSCSYEIDWLRS